MKLGGHLERFTGYQHFHSTLRGIPHEILTRWISLILVDHFSLDLLIRNTEDARGAKAHKLINARIVISKALCLNEPPVVFPIGPMASQSKEYKALSTTQTAAADQFRFFHLNVL